MHVTLMKNGFTCQAVTRKENTHLRPLGRQTKKHIFVKIHDKSNVHGCYCSPYFQLPKPISCKSASRLEERNDLSEKS